MPVGVGFGIGYESVCYGQQEKRQNKQITETNLHTLHDNYLFFCLPLWLAYKLLKVKGCVLAPYFSTPSTYQALNKYLFDCGIY